MRYTLITLDGISFLRTERFICRADQIRSVSLSLNSDNKVNGVRIICTDNTVLVVTENNEQKAITMLDEIWMAMGGGIHQ